MIGLLLILAGVVLLITGIRLILSNVKQLHEYTTYQQENRSYYNDTSKKQPGGFKGAGVIMLGPIPIVFGNDKNMIKTSIILVLLLMITWFLLFR